MNSCLFFLGFGSYRLSVCLSASSSPPQLKPYYMDFVSQLPTSPNQSAVRGLNLLFLLVENRLAEFHSELELMGDGERASECVVFPVRLEQYLMVGSYDQASRTGMRRRGIRALCMQWGGRGACASSLRVREEKSTPHNIFRGLRRQGGVLEASKIQMSCFIYTGKPIALVCF